MKSIEGHLTPSKDGTTPTVWENSKYNSHASITFDFSDSTGEKIFGIDTTLRSRSDGSGKFIALPSKLGSDGKYYKEVSCSREISNLLNEKGLALYDEELSKKNKGIVQESTQKREKKNTQSRYQLNAYVWNLTWHIDNIPKTIKNHDLRKRIPHFRRGIL